MLTVKSKVEYDVVTIIVYNSVDKIGVEKASTHAEPQTAASASQI